MYELIYNEFLIFSALDDLLGDGVPSKNILEIVGDNASGKMQV